MTLTVRLDATLESSLERYCAATGTTKSLVVQESLAAYLLASQMRAAGGGADGARSKSGAAVSGNYQAFANAGLIGAGELGGVSADKAAVRARVRQRVGRADR